MSSTVVVVEYMYRLVHGYYKDVRIDYTHFLQITSINNYCYICNIEIDLSIRDFKYF